MFCRLLKYLWLASLSTRRFPVWGILKEDIITFFSCVWLHMVGNHISFFSNLACTWSLSIGTKAQTAFESSTVLRSCRLGGKWRGWFLDGKPYWKEARLRLALLWCFHLTCWRETSLMFSLSLFLKGQGWTRVNAGTKLVRSHAVSRCLYKGAYIFTLLSLSTAATVASVPAMSAGLCWGDFDWWGTRQYQETFLTAIIRDGDTIGIGWAGDRMAAKHLGAHRTAPCRRESAGSKCNRAKISKLHFVSGDKEDYGAN